MEVYMKLLTEFVLESNVILCTFFIALPRYSQLCFTYNNFVTKLVKSKLTAPTLNHLC